MVQKRRQALEQVILKQDHLYFELKYLVRQSIRRNMEVTPRSRYFCFQTGVYYYKPTYWSRNRLHCILSLKNRVPYSKVFLSRFFLARWGDNLALTSLRK